MTSASTGSNCAASRFDGAVRTSYFASPAQEGQPGVDHDLRAGDIAAGVGDEVKDQIGDLLGVGDAELVAAGVLAATVPLVLAAAHRPLTAVAFAPSPRLRPARVRAALLALIGVAIVVAVPGLGNLLVLALLVAPGVAASPVASVGGRLVAAALVGGACGALGVLASDRLGTAAGASVAIVLVAVALLTLLAKGGGGALRRSPIEALAERA